MLIVAKVHLQVRAFRSFVLPIFKIALYLNTFITDSQSQSTHPHAE